MRKPGKRAVGRSKRATHTICCTDEEWEEVVAGAAKAGKSMSSWWVECALNVDLSTKGPRAQPLVLDTERQRAIADGMSELARGLDANAEVVRQAQDDIRAMLEEPLQRMAREGRREQAMELLREVFGDERAAVIAAALMPEPDGTVVTDMPD